MKQLTIRAALLAFMLLTPVISGCSISKSFSIHKDRPCGCYGPRHGHHCPHYHRPPRTGSHHSSDHGNHFLAARASSSSIVKLDHRPMAKRPSRAQPSPRPKPPRAKPVTRSSPNRAVRVSSGQTKANHVKSQQTKSTKKRDR
jgi:hypothetical protein